MKSGLLVLAVFAASLNAQALKAIKAASVTIQHAQ
jgi:hypothetical protein